MHRYDYASQHARVPRASQGLRRVHALDGVQRALEAFAGGIARVEP